MASQDSALKDPPFDVLAPWGAAGPAPIDRWGTDLLGAGFESMTLPLLADDEGPAVATLVRHLPHLDPPYQAGVTPWLPLQGSAANTTQVLVLYLHGRNDYFFNVELARQLSSLGAAFYALDLRKYGRSLRQGQTIGYAEDLSVYDEEIGLALETMRAEHPHLPLIIMGHSTGGLIGTLWTYRHPGVCAGLILNSAWLELQTMANIRPAMRQVVGQLASRRPRATIVNSKSDVYGRSLLHGRLGADFPLPAQLQDRQEDPGVKGWAFAPEWKRLHSYPAPAAWFEAILTGQQEVAKRVALDCPVLSLCSTQSTLEEEMTPAVFVSDIVLDIDVIVERSAKLSRLVTIARFAGRHDLTLSDPDVRAELYQVIGDWLHPLLSVIVPAESRG